MLVLGRAVRELRGGGRALVARTLEQLCAQGRDVQAAVRSWLAAARHATSRAGAVVAAAKRTRAALPMHPELERALGRQLARIGLVRPTAAQRHARATQLVMRARAGGLSATEWAELRDHRHEAARYLEQLDRLTPRRFPCSSST